MLEAQKQAFILENNFLVSQSEINIHLLNKSMRDLWVQNTEDDKTFFPKYLYSEEVGVIDLEHFSTGMAMAELYDETLGKMDLENVVLGTSPTESALLNTLGYSWESFEWIVGSIQKLQGYEKSSAE